MWTARSVALVLIFAACGGKYGGATTPTGPAMPAGGIAAAALPYHVLDRAGREVDRAEFWTKLAAAHAVCVGEDHPNPHHHWVQLEVMRQVTKTATPPLALGMEMFQRPFQGVLDDYGAKRIDSEALRSRAGWAERWGYEYGLYGPTIDVAVGAKAQLLALNAPKELTKKVVRKGLASLTPEEKAQVPELNLDDKQHRAWFDALMEGMGGAGGHAHKAQPKPMEEPERETAKEEEKAPGKDAESPVPAVDPHADVPAMPSADAIYTVQVMWDETMAETSAAWLKTHPSGRIVILAGNGHCHDSAIVNRMKRRGVADAISVRPVIDDGEGAVAELLAKPMNDYVIVLKMPRK